MKRMHPLECILTPFNWGQDARWFIIRDAEKSESSKQADLSTVTASNHASLLSTSSSVASSMNSLISTLSSTHSSGSSTTSPSPPFSASSWLPCGIQPVARSFSYDDIYQLLEWSTMAIVKSASSDKLEIPHSTHITRSYSW
jgi:hypothetical protein